MHVDVCRWLVHVTRNVFRDVFFRHLFFPPSRSPSLPPSFAPSILPSLPPSLSLSPPSSLPASLPASFPPPTPSFRHAFQSLVWNLAASERVKLYGWEGAVEGDLVFPKNASASSPDAMLAEPEVLIDAQEEASPGVGEDRGAGEEAAAGDSLEKREVKRAKTVRAPLPEVHVVTKEDVESGVFRLSDVVLPMPG